MNSEDPPIVESKLVESSPSPDDEFPVDRLKSRVNESLNKRPLTVYLVLFAGAATLLLLLGVVWISSRSGGKQQELICTEIAPSDARTAILGSQVERINVLVDSENPVESLTGIQMRFIDGTCRQTPQGADLRAELFSIIGAVDLMNHYGGINVEVHYQAQNIEPELLASSTPTPPPTVEPSVTPTLPDPTATPPLPTETAVPPTVASSSTSVPVSTMAVESSASPDQRAPVGDPGS